MRSIITLKKCSYYTPLPLFMLILSTSAWGAIVRDGSCTASATNCTLSVVNTNDLVVTFAFRSGSTTAPTADGSNTSITTIATTTGGTTGAARVSCRYATSSSDTSSGTYANATSVASVSYSGTRKSSTANCGTAGIGGSANNNAKASTSEDFPTITMQGTSWVVAFDGASASSHFTPSAMTQVATTGTVAVSDSNAAVSSRADSSGTVTSETWITWVGEVVASATPAIVQYGQDANAGSLATQTWNSFFPNGTKAGNCIIAVAWAGSASATPTVSDDKSNTYTSTTAIVDSTNQSVLQVFFAPNVIVGTQHVTVNMGISTPFHQAWIFEVQNIALTSTLDAQTGRLTSGTALATANFTTTIDGDFIFYVAAVNAFSAQTVPMSWTAGTGMTFIIPDDAEFVSTSYQVQSTHSTTTAPSATSSFSATGAVVKAIALKAAVAGASSGSGIKVVGKYNQNFEATSFFTFAGTSLSVQEYVTGNLIVVAGNQRPTDKVTSISSSPSLTWSTTTSSDSGSTSVDDSVEFWYAPGATPGTLYTITITWPSTPNAADFNFFDIAGAATSPFDTVVSHSGSDSTLACCGGTLVVAAETIVPTTTNGLVLSFAQQAGHTITAMSPSEFVAVDIRDSGNAHIYAAGATDTDEGLGVYYNATTASQQISYTYTGTQPATTGIGKYCSQSIAFKATGASSAFTASVSEGGVYGDSSSRIKGFIRSLTDSSGSSELSSGILNAMRASIETSISSEVSVRAFTGSRSMSDSTFSVYDKSSKGQAISILVVEGAISYDVAVRGLTLTRAVGESYYSIDLSSRIFTGSRLAYDASGYNNQPGNLSNVNTVPFSESVWVSDIATRVLTLSRGVNEGTYTSNLTARSFVGSRSLLDSIYTIGDSVAKGQAKTVSVVDSINPTGDSIGRVLNTFRQFTDVNAVSELVARLLVMSRLGSDVSPGVPTGNATYNSQSNVLASRPRTNHRR